MRDLHNRRSIRRRAEQTYRNNRVRDIALRRLAANHPDEYRDLLAETRAEIERQRGPLPERVVKHRETSRSTANRQPTAQHSPSTGPPQDHPFTIETCPP